MGAVVVSTLDTLLANVLTPFPFARTRVLHALWSLALAVSLGAAFDLWDWLWIVVAGRRRWVLPVARLALGYAGASWLVSTFILFESVHTLDGRFVTLLRIGTTAAFGAGFVASSTIGGWARVFPLAVVLGLAAATANLFVLPDDHAELHAAATIYATLLLGHALTTRAWAEARWMRRGSLVLAAVAAIGLIPPPYGIRVTLFQSLGNAGAWIAANTFWRLPHFDVVPEPRTAASHLEKTSDPALRNPTTPRPIDRPPVVVLVTVEAFRADLVVDPANAKRFPNLLRMQREGVSFTAARAPGSQTAVTLSSTFAGKYFSELKWLLYGHGAARFHYPAEDPTPRFPSMLRERGIPTFKVASLAYLANEFGIAPGFEDERVLAAPRQHALAADVLRSLSERLQQVGHAEPLFAYLHLTEPHEPYDRGHLKTGTAWERYMSEVAVVDGVLGTILTFLGAPNLAGRSLLIVTGDHGEAFGEHRTTFHSKTLYEEMVRVPLVVWGAGVRHRAVGEPVSLIDLGPTILDWFDAPSPGWHAGQSLVPLLVGGNESLSRPLMTEGRLRRALYAGDLKVIVDARRKTVELYDLAKDPREADNLFDRDGARGVPALWAMSRYFEAHAFREGGYEAPYRP